MADTIGIILEYLHRHHFTRAETVLREEVSERRQFSSLAPLPLNDDRDLDVVICLNSMQEKSGQKRGELEALPNKRPQDKLVTNVEPAAALGLAVKELPHGQVESIWPSTKVEVSEPLFMEFDVVELEHSTKPKFVFSVENSPSPVLVSPTSESKTVELSRSPGRIGGLSTLQTEAEVAATSSVEKVVSERQKLEASDLLSEKLPDSNIRGGSHPASHLEKELFLAQETSSAQVLCEATRGKVDALKQRWEPKTTDKPTLEREKSSRAVMTTTKKEESQTEKVIDSNGRLTPIQAIENNPLDSTIDVQLMPRDKSNVNAVLHHGTKAEGTGAGSMDPSVPKSPEWTEVPIKTIPPMKASASVAADGKKNSEERREETFSVIPSYSYSERFQTGPKLEPLSQASGKQGSDSQPADVSVDEVKKHATVDLSRLEETSSTVVERKLTCVAPRSAQEGLPKLAPVRLRSIDAKTLEIVQDECVSDVKKVESPPPVNVAGTANATAFGLGSYLDIPVGQDISSGDGQSDSAVEYADEYWDSDTYEDDDDPGYHRQPIEDEEWFLAHEIDYPSDDERARPNVEAQRSSRREKDYEKYEKYERDEPEDCSVLEEESYFSGEESLAHRIKEGREERKSPIEVHEIQTSELFGRMDGGDNFGINGQVANATRILDPGQFNRQLLGADGVPLMGSDSRWQSLDPSKGTQSEEGGSKQHDYGRAVQDISIFKVEEDRVGLVRFGGMGGSGEVAESGSVRRESVRAESSEGDLDMSGIVARSMRHLSSLSQVGNSDIGKAQETESSRKHDDEEEDLILKYYNSPWVNHKNREGEREASSLDTIQFLNRENEKSCGTQVSSIRDGESHRHKDSELAGATGFGGFSFPSPSASGGDIGTVSRVGSGKSMWSVRDITGQALGEETEDYGNGASEPDDPLASWRRKSNDSSPILSPREAGHQDLFMRSTGSAKSTDGYGSAVAKDGDAEEGDEIEQEPEEESMLEVDQQIREAEAAAAEDEEAAAIQEQIRRMRTDEEFETFDLKIIHRKNRTGFEEDKDFPVVINAVVAGRYHVTEYLGSAAFSKAIQAHDLHTGMDVCMKIIKNNKDFFDQSLDEIKLLKYINKHDPGDKHHLLRLYDYFYHREHLFIVCELLRANLYEFHKYNRESGGEVYFTMPRLQSIARQCLEALEFIHGLGLIHCDLKPENILVKSYSRCEIKVIDLGSSCFQTDHLCSYVQSRSYRAPEVILGLPYDQKIDMWSLGCILAELCSGNVLFQNDSLATLLARVVGILGPIDPELLSKGRDSHKFFTKNHTLYERNQDSDQLEYLLPKKTSLAHRLPMGDQGFVAFVGYLLNINPLLRPTASEALKHPWLSFPYEPISS
ncbi:uncharacterized protein [Physcomitrium patens]|uniref:uncharacterized protein isoform X2 n=1 Tax=Physcomitrium patens TaxID=3218 RepID=UPI000D15F115|nr:uncharacterized protein LOC112288073 isoform X2 [Physcomitrium patens]|eukprot:XP_024387669.1 uncharacterized protein LOC112288073 isoform X2 [Physcomitrella patens]